jgi:hypothetical protein
LNGVSVGTWAEEGALQEQRKMLAVDNGASPYWNI